MQRENGVVAVHVAGNKPKEILPPLGASSGFVKSADKANEKLAIANHVSLSVKILHDWTSSREVTQ